MEEIKNLVQSLFDPNFIRFIEDDEFYICEKKNLGKGKCIFKKSENTLLIHMHENKFWALKNKQCAEAAFVHFNHQHQATLYLLEMKKGMRIETFSSALSQLEGMYLSALSVLSLLEIKPVEIKAIIAFSDDKKINDSAYQNPKDIISHKILVGQKQTTKEKNYEREYSIWHNEIINFPFNKTAKLIKKQRKCEQNCNETECHHEFNADCRSI